MSRWVFVVGIPAILVVSGVLFAGDRWPEVAVGACGVGVAMYFGRMQQELGEQMHTLAERQAEMTERQTQTQEILRRLTTIPVLAASWHHEPTVVMLDNCGSGPATDIRANVCRPGQDVSAPPTVVFNVARQGGRSHLGPQDGELRLQAEQRAEPVHKEEGVSLTDPEKGDVWIIHCGDLTGSHWHAWCNWTREDRHSPGEPFIFESVERTPAWIRRNCARCKELTQSQSS
jgi:hypothetical protein